MMPDDDMIHALLGTWSTADQVTGDMKFEWAEDGPNTLGLCIFRHEGAEKAATIHLNPKLQGHRVLILGVLWHEYNHFAEWWIYDSTGHGLSWLKLMLRDVTLCCYDVVAKIVYQFLSDK